VPFSRVMASQAYLACGNRPEADNQLRGAVRDLEAGLKDSKGSGPAGLNAWLEVA